MKKFVEKKIIIIIIIIIFFILTASVLLISRPAEAECILKKGMSGENILALQTSLREKGYYSGNLDGIFGILTYQAVKQFQADNGLEVDGIAGLKTLTALGNISQVTGSEELTLSRRVLRRGMTGEDILQLQSKMKEYGYYQGPLDGIFGSLTYSAVISFQITCGLGVDGMTGSETLEALNNYNPSILLASRSSIGDRKARAVVNFALKHLGTPYVWGGSTPYGFDCSGFTTYVFKEFGVILPHSADQQYRSGSRVNQPGPGDLVFFTTYKRGPSHVGIYIGNSHFVHSSSGTGQVRVTSLNEPYYSSRYLGSVRVVN